MQQESWDASPQAQAWAEAFGTTIPAVPADRLPELLIEVLEATIQAIKEGRWTK